MDLNANAKALSEAVAAWHAARSAPGEETSTDLGVKVHRYASQAGLDNAAAMKHVRTMAEAAAQPDPRAEMPAIQVLMEEDPIPMPDPAATRKAAWSRLVKAYRASKAEANETTSAELGAASFAFGKITGEPAEEAVRRVRTAAWRKDVGERRLMIGYMSPQGRFGNLPIVNSGPLEDMRDVREMEAELIKQGLLPVDSVIMGWSLFDKP